MPTYDYKCPKCGTVFERVQKMTSPPKSPCPKCGATAQRLMSGGHGLVFKGSGFYETDYKRPGEKAKHDKRKKREEGGASGGGGGTEKPAPPKPDSSQARPKAD
jgi:putative FmdB family regulatory protein